MKRVPVYRRADLVAWAIVDDEAYDTAIERLWRLDQGYVLSYAQGERMFLHRLVMGMEPGNPGEVDHIDGEKLDNRRGNLRLATHAQNGQNLPNVGTRGTYFNRRAGRWVAQACVKGVQNYLGLYDTQQEAAAVAAEFRATRMPFSSEFLARERQKEIAA
jgi:hypothetical protein